MFKYFQHQLKPFKPIFKHLSTNYALILPKITNRRMSVKSNVQVIYKEVPKPGTPNPNEHFEIRKCTIDLDKTHLSDGEILLRTLYISVDPYIRGRLVDPAKSKSHVPPYKVGQPLSSGVLAEVVRTKNPKYVLGDVVVGLGSWENYFVSNPESGLTGIRKIPKPRDSPFPISYHLGILGHPGLTAYIGLHKICENIKPGQTLFISSAAGAVGQVVGQYGKALGLRVVGSAGDDKKVKFLENELGFDAAFNYKTRDGDLDIALKETCPNGIDIYFENVGGKMLDAVLLTCNPHARIVGSGMITQYGEKGPEPIHNISLVVAKRIRFEGFITFEDLPKYATEGITTFTKLIKEGRLKYLEDVTKGIENTPQAFVDMLQGKNFGKAIVHVADL